METRRELKRCVRCLLPETHETIEFDEKGVCNVCRQQEFKKGQKNWDEAKARLDALVEKFRGKGDYDCIIPFSGGKDSVWILYYMMTHYKVKPLVVRFNHGFLRPNLHENVTNVLRKLGADFIDFTPNWHLVRKLLLQTFLEKGDFCWHCHTGCAAYPLHVAVKYNVPFMLYGEPPSEYTAYYNYEKDEMIDEEKFNRIANLGINASDMFLRLGGDFDERDLKPFTYPSAKDLKRLGYTGVYLGSYVPWDVRRQSKIIMDELGWKGDRVEGVDPRYNYEKIECHFQGVRDYIKFIKRGYARNSHLAAIDVRNGRMTTEEAKKMVEQDGQRPASLDIFLKFLGITEEEFNKVALSHQVAPYQHDFAKTPRGEKLHDHDQWFQNCPMPEEEAAKIIGRFKDRNKP